MRATAAKPVEGDGCIEIIRTTVMAPRSRSHAKGSPQSCIARITIKASQRFTPQRCERVARVEHRTAKPSNSQVTDIVHGAGSCIAGAPDICTSWCILIDVVDSFHSFKIREDLKILSDIGHRAAM
ncbi:MAG: hypothetical protein ACLQF1_19845 [Methyloceanibacter sp.]